MPWVIITQSHLIKGILRTRFLSCYTVKCKQSGTTLVRKLFKFFLFNSYILSTIIIIKNIRIRVISILKSREVWCFGWTFNGNVYHVMVMSHTNWSNTGVSLCEIVKNKYIPRTTRIKIKKNIKQNVFRLGIRIYIYQSLCHGKNMTHQFLNEVKAALNSDFSFSLIGWQNQS